MRLVYKRKLYKMILSFSFLDTPSLSVYSVYWKSVLIERTKRASNGNTPPEDITSASSGNPFSWFSPRRLRVKNQRPPVGGDEDGPCKGPEPPLLGAADFLMVFVYS
jgi:hypothetical protein